MPASQKVNHPSHRVSIIRQPGDLIEISHCKILWYHRLSGRPLSTGCLYRFPR
jgi:hypothetical protein